MLLPALPSASAVPADGEPRGGGGGGGGSRMAVPSPGGGTALPTSVFGLNLRRLSSVVLIRGGAGGRRRFEADSPFRSGVNGADSLLRPLGASERGSLLTAVRSERPSSRCSERTSSRRSGTSGEGERLPHLGDRAGIEPVGGLAHIVPSAEPADGLSAKVTVCSTLCLFW